MKRLFRITTLLFFMFCNFVIYAQNKKEVMEKRIYTRLVMAKYKVNPETSVPAEHLKVSLFLSFFQNSLNKKNTTVVFVSEILEQLQNYGYKFISDELIYKDGTVDESKVFKLILNEIKENKAPLFVKDQYFIGVDFANCYISDAGSSIFDFAKNYFNKLVIYCDKTGEPEAYYYSYSFNFYDKLEDLMNDEDSLHYVDEKNKFKEEINKIKN